MAKVARPSLQATVRVGTPTAKEVEELAEQIHNKSALTVPAPEEVTEEAMHRLTLDLPKPLLETIRAEAKKRRYTIKGFLLMLVDNYFEENAQKK
ncbi:MAG: hypothetical protein JNL70_27830 [Saprospiraceae bacterium]|nr:hypothetical protein [Saprospiraceae bacterium]